MKVGKWASGCRESGRGGEVVVVELYLKEDNIRYTIKMAQVYNSIFPDPIYNPHLASTIHPRRTTINLEKMSASDTQPHLGDPLTDVSSYVYA